MIVDHVCDSVNGGAGGAAVRLHRALQSLGVESRFWHSPQGVREDDPAIQPLVWPSARGRFSAARSLVDRSFRTVRYQWRKFRYLQGRPAEWEVFTSAERRRPTPFPRDLLRGDVLVLHWLGKMADYPTFFGGLLEDRPVVWTLHDMNPFTGGCHFSRGCDRYTDVCGCCPQLSHAGRWDLSRRTATIKRVCLARLGIHAVTPSQWLTRACQRSTILKDARSFHTIPYGLELADWTPFEKRHARRELGLDPHRSVIAFGADVAGNARKGFAPLLAAWERLATPRPVGLFFGGGTRDHDQRDHNFVHFGYLSDRRRQSLVYAAADVFVLPSLEDNLPQTGLEAMACGTPVAAFEVGGIPDFVRPQVTGHLAPVGDAEGLAQRVQSLLDAPKEAARMGRAARAMIEREYAQPREAHAYLELFRQIAPHCDA